LGKGDTGFVVPEAKWTRFATQYSPREGGGIRPMKDPESFGLVEMSPNEAYRASRRYFPGGAGLVSTARDYARFAQMLLNGGELDGARILSPKSVELMTVSHTGDMARPPLGASDFGLGFGIIRDLGWTQQLGSVGAFSWGGIYGTSFWVDPKEKLVGVWMTQLYPNPTSAGARFQALAYQALVR
jgi:CubicO group peptidase (beta-lactamase class C family)